MARNSHKYHLEQLQKHCRVCASNFNANQISMLLHKTRAVGSSGQQLVLTSTLTPRHSPTNSVPQLPGENDKNG
jgi:hypothetical protein